MPTPVIPPAIRPFTPASLAIYFWVHSVPFTRAVLEGRTSLGGSESACLGLAAALAARGHDVHIFTTQLRLEDGDPTVYNGVQWHGADMLADTLAFAPPDVFCALRDPTPFGRRTGAGLNLLWNQDLLLKVEQVSGALPQIDALVYVSAFHRQQWAGVDEAVLGHMPSYVTRNGFDPATVIAVVEQRATPAAWDGVSSQPAVRTRQPLQFVHISRPERALDPLLQMWPKIRERLPEATLHLCRYDSMYDAGGWGKICEAYDQKTARVQAQVGGIVMHGQLSKPELYDLLLDSAIMLYPGVYDFAETSCIAVIEAQACGAVPVASYRGALPETIGEGAGMLIEGDASTAEYQTAYVDAVCALAQDPERQQAMRAAGAAHVTRAYSFATIAAEWEAWIIDRFQARYQANRLGVMRQLLHWDNHLPAAVVARDILTTAQAEGRITEGERLDLPDTPAECREALEALHLVDLVVAQVELDEEGYSKYALPTEYEAATSTRINEMADRIAALDPTPRVIADVACGNGAMILALCARLPEAQIYGFDFSPGVIAAAQAAVDRAGYTDRVTLRVGSWETVEGTYDALFCGEFLEHVASPERVINRLEQHCAPTGRVFLTTPCGPFFELLDYTVPRKRGHVHAFSMDDIRQLFGAKPQVEWGYLPQGVSPRGSAVGYWLIGWAPGGPPSPALDYTRTIYTARPKRRVVAGLIVRNEEQWLRKCLASIWPLVDAIVVVDTGSFDKSAAIAQEYGAFVYRRSWQDDFAAARNEVLRLATEEHGADWFLWIDADEHIVGGEHMHLYLEGESPFLAFVIRQHHLMLDADRFYDVPCRLFRTDRGIRFFGVVHEQPETAINAGIFPALDTPDLNIVHYGYETEGQRRGKLLTRNFELLKKELRGPEPRDMAWVLLIRELVTLAGYEHAATPGRQTPLQQRRALGFLHMAIKTYQQRGFADPAHKLHGLIYPSYALALQWLGIGVEVEWAFAAAPGTLGKGRVRPERFRARDAAEAEALVQAKLRAWMAQLTPAMQDCRPWAQARAAEVPLAAAAAASEPQGAPFDEAVPVPVQDAPEAPPAVE